MDNDSTKTTKWLALIGGFLLAILVCGVPLFYIVNTGSFRRIGQPFVNAVQTVAVVPISTVEDIQGTPALATLENNIASLPYSERFDMAGPAISEAMQNSMQGNSAEAILSWTKVIEIIPEWDGGYYNRGLEYLKLLNNQRSQEEYLYSLSLAGKDFNKAIELDPSNGNYYYARFRYYDALSSNQTTRADTDYLENIALDNLLTANRLGNYEQNSEIKVALVYLAVGQCDEAINQANRLIAKTNEPSVDMIGSLSIGYFCKNDTANALKYMNKVVELVDGCQSRFDRARIFYVIGRLDDALTDLDVTISKSPYYCGMRYYLRGLIYAEKGEFDKAQNDLDLGMRQTWERGGLLSYAQGKIALAHGD
jgi:tetratricopeptide (TPR) repeat protein